MKLFLACLVLAGCAQVTSLNMQKHEFGVLPTKIIWFQIAGLEEEQFAMLRFQFAGEKKTAFEENTCIGKTWDYNLYQLRNSASASFLSQMTGKKNIKQNCEDADLRPIWSYLVNNGYRTGILEIGASDDQSLLGMNNCQEAGKEFLSSLNYWVRKQQAPVGPTFHYRETVPMAQDNVYFDKTCDKQTCLSSITDDFKSIYESFKKVSHKHMMIIRDFSFLEALNKKDLIRARGVLNDLEHALADAISKTKNNNEYLVLVTSAESRFVDMPDQGKGWYDFEKNNSNFQVKRTKLTNLVLANGARAENFCGMYEDSQVFERILSGPKQLGLELKFINPFK